MKLKKPIVLTIEDTATAVWLAMLTGYNKTCADAIAEHCEHARLIEKASNTEYAYELIVENLESIGIFYDEWTPPAPAPTVEILNDGSARFSDGKVLSKGEIAALVEKRNESLPEEWPKYFQCGDCVWRCYSEEDNGQFFRYGQWNDSIAPTLISVAKKHPHVWIPITKFQAELIIGKNL